MPPAQPPGPPADTGDELGTGYAVADPATAVGAPAAAASGQVPACTADPDTIRAWLAGPSGQSGLTRAEQLGIDEQFHLQSHTLAGDLNTLLTAASDANVFGVPDHRVELWIVADNDHLVDGHPLTVDFPDGTRLASYHLPADDLLDDDLEGVDAAVGVLVNAKRIVDELLDQHHTHLLRPAGPAAGAAAALAASSFSTAAQPAAAPPAPATPATGQPPVSHRHGGARHGR